MRVRQTHICQKKADVGHRGRITTGTVQLEKRSVLSGLRHGEERPIAGDFPLFFEGLPVELSQLAFGRIIEHYQISSGIDASDDDIVQCAAVSDWVKRDDPRAPLAEMLFKILPGAPQYEGAIVVLLKIVLHR